MDMNHSGDPAAISDPLGFLAGGEMGERTRSFDWSATPVGPVAAWPQSLKTAVRIMLGSRYAMWLGWGPAFTFFYNDAYARMTLGPKHPWALGRSAREVWSEIWDDIGPRAERVMSTGEATWDESLLLFLERRDFPEETYHTFSYSPVPDESGGVGGMLCVVTEDTERTIGERRLRTLRELAARTTEEAKSVEEACQTAARTLAGNPNDLPFVLIYLLDDSTARLAGATGLPGGIPAAPVSVDLADADATNAGWPLRAVRQSGRGEVVTGLEERFGPLRCGPWPEPTRQAVVVPMVRSGQPALAGFVVAGVSPRLVLNDVYRGFLDLLAGHVATSVANARAYEEERRRAEALAELDRVKTAFFSNVSHEFRTPLTLMLGPLSELLSQSTNRVQPEQRELLEVVNRNGLRLLRLVNTLLDFARIEAGRVQASYQPTDLAAVTADLASNFRSACERAGLVLVVDCPPLAEPVFVDREMWENVVLNLLSNAFKFTFDGQIIVALRQANGTVELRVSDTGTGIPAEEMPRLFERFHRVENARGRTHEGSGIGLALVQELVKLHGGNVTAQSVPGQGSTFQVTLPLGAAHLPPDRIGSGHTLASTALKAQPYIEEALRWLPDAGLGEDDHRAALTADFDSVAPAAFPHGVERADRPRVLVADDNADMRQYILRLLAEQFEVEAVADGQEALAEARRQAPDLILTDVMMPQLDGFGLVRELRADPRTRALPVILLSARAGEESRVEGLEAGADDYLVKPFGARELLARVTAQLQMARLRREANESLRQGEERLRMALIAARMVAWEYDPTSGRVVVSDNATEVLGLPPGFRLENVEQGLALLHPDDAPRHRATLQQAVQDCSDYLIQFRLIRPDNGATIWLEERGHAVCPEPGRCTHLVGVVLDVTDRIRAEEMTRARSEQLRRLAEVATRLSAAPDVASVCGVVSAEARDLIAAHQSILSFTTDQNWAQAINARSLSEKYAAWQAYDAMPDGSGIHAEVCSTNRPMRMTQAELEAHPGWQESGRHAAVRPPLRGWLAAPLVGRDGRNLGLIQLSDKYRGDFTADDEAILVQLARMASVAIENARLVENLRDADKRKDEFLATLAHELRNPLAPLRNGLQILKRVGNAPGPVEQARGMMDRQLGHMIRLIDDLMDLSRISRGKITLRKERVELGKVVTQAVETSRPLFEENDHALTIQVPPRPICVDADVTRLAQVFANLLNNAAKYTERGGRILLSVERLEASAVVRVQDTGVGIPAHMLPQLFEMFTQVDRSLERSRGGLGIGLSLVKQLVEMHGGSVEAHSEGHGLGSEFVVRLPVVLAVEFERPAEENEPQPAAIERRILVVDDNRDAAVSLALMLKLQGNQTRTAHDGLEAVAEAEAFRPDVVLLDIGMPKLNGYDAARRIREQPWGQRMVLVALTGWGQEEDRRRSLEAGFNHHLVKPVDPAALEKLLASLGSGTA
jgi:PAS domain S-box-containing protein